MRKVLVFAMAAAALGGTALPAQQQQAGKKSAAELKAAYEKRKGDFDYLIYDEYRVLGDSGETWYHTTSLRAYNAQLDRWELVSTEEGGGLANTGTARKVGDEMHIEARRIAPAR